MQMSYHVIMMPLEGHHEPILPMCICHTSTFLKMKTLKVCKFSNEFVQIGFKTKKRKGM